MLPRSLLAIPLLGLLGLAAHAGDLDIPAPVSLPASIWSGLVLATNDPHPAAPPPELVKYAAQLKNIFGYAQFELIGQSTEKMDGPYEHWLTPSKDFCLSVRSHTQPGDQRYPLRMALYQNRHHLADFEAHLTADSPLFIRGPMYGHGQLIIILHVADAAPQPSPHS